MYQLILVQLTDSHKKDTLSLAKHLHMYQYTTNYTLSLPHQGSCIPATSSNTDNYPTSTQHKTITLLTDYHTNTHIS